MDSNAIRELIGEEIKKKVRIKIITRDYDEWTRTEFKIILLYGEEELSSESFTIEN